MGQKTRINKFRVLKGYSWVCSQTSHVAGSEDLWDAGNQIQVHPRSAMSKENAPQLCYITLATKVCQFVKATILILCLLIEICISGNFEKTVNIFYSVLNPRISKFVYQVKHIVYKDETNSI